MTDITNAAKKGRSGQTSSEQLESILNWIELSSNNYNLLVGKSTHENPSNIIFVLFRKNLFCFAKRAVLFRNILTLKPPIISLLNQLFNFVALATVAKNVQVHRRVMLKNTECCDRLT